MMTVVTNNDGVTYNFIIVTGIQVTGTNKSDFT